MRRIVTLIANPAEFVLTETIVARVRAAIAGGEPDWLSSGEAADLPTDTMFSRATILAALEGAPVDAIVSPAEGRRKKLLIADMDSTIVTSETLDEIAAHAGLKDRIAAITRRSMNGEIDFSQALRDRVGMLKGLSLDALAKTWARTALTDGARELVATMRANGAVTALVSGGFTYFTARVAEEVGFHIHRANVLLDDGAALTGEVGEPILDRDAKLAVLRELVSAQGLEMSDTMATGDGANDLAMLREAGMGIAFRAKPIVAAEARAQVDHAGLRALLFAQGYRATEIVPKR
jgi:phosphoserine phosphatase